MQSIKIHNTCRLLLKTQDMLCVNVASLNQICITNILCFFMSLSCGCVQQSCKLVKQTQLESTFFLATIRMSRLLFMVLPTQVRRYMCGLFLCLGLLHLGFLSFAVA